MALAVVVPLELIGVDQYWCRGHVASLGTSPFGLHERLEVEPDAGAGDVETDNVKIKEDM